jgi:hypothetical protein
MTYKIYALTSYGREEIDQASTFEEASFLIEQYQSAFSAVSVEPIVCALSELPSYSKP